MATVNLEVLTLMGYPYYIPEEHEYIYMQENEMCRFVGLEECNAQASVEETTSRPWSAAASRVVRKAVVALCRGWQTWWGSDNGQSEGGHVKNHRSAKTA